MKPTNRPTTFLKLPVLILCFLTAAFSFSQTDQKEIAGTLTFETDIIDYGKIPHKADGVRVFSFKNTGNAPVVISNVKTSCGCTVPTYPKTAIMPGDTGEISVKYATNRVGVFSKTITVMSNASESKKLLRIKGEVLKNTDEQQ
ncbi:MAG: DUF1573 domain-containing protein [Algicola sp.]|nr:DUF1573 domain-containing protein [Algicola sp.]